MGFAIQQFKVTTGIQRRYLWLVWFTLCLGWGELNAQSLPIVLSDIEETVQIGNQTLALEDESAKLSINDILNDSCQQVFEALKQPVFNKPASTAVFWFKFNIDVQAEEQLWLEIGNELSSSSLEFYAPDSLGNYSQPIKLGIFHPKQPKHFPSPIYMIPLIKGQHIYYLRSSSLFPKTHVFQVGKVASIIHSTHKMLIIVWLFVGVVGSIIIYNIFLYVSSRDTIYLFYAFERLWIIWVITFDSEYSLFDSPWLWTYFFIWHNIIYFLQALFTDEYLDLKKTLPKSRKWLWGISSIMFLVFPLLNIIATESFTLIVNIFQPFVVIQYLLSIGLGVVVWKKGHKQARFYVIAWAVAILGISIYLLTLNGLIPFNFWTGNALFICFATESLLFAFALGDRLNIIKAERDVAQQETVTLLQTQQERLEKLVAKRTKELLAVNQSISAEKNRAEEAYNALQKAQDQVMQSEKMASLGQLTAGIAHEINNPINFITGGAQNLRDNLGGLLKLLGLYEKVTWGNEEKTSILAQIREEEEVVGNTGNLKEDMSIMLSGIEVGAKRIANIVLGLRNFSRTDRHRKVHDNLHNNINNSLLILSSKYRGRIEIIRDFQIENPVIECYSGQLGQVFVNIIGNAIDAIPDEGRIIISTKDLNEQVWISIKDTGRGIPEEVLSSVFNPFFTTKDVGDGTGLGLSISHGIIENHNGTIKALSEPGNGAEFIITLPR